MKANQAFVHGGGWVIRQRVGRPMMRFFAFAALVWLCVAVIAGMLLWAAPADVPGGLWWACVFSVALEPVFVVLAVLCRLFEKPRTVVEQVANPNCDDRNLY